MKKLSRRYFKFTLVFVGFIFTLSLVHWMGDGLFLKPSLAEAANPAIGLTKDNPGIRTAIQVQNKHTERLMGIPGVVGHGVGISSDGEPVIKIFVARAGIPGIPSALEGVPTKVEVTGMVIAYADPTARFPRPVPIGVSTGHPDITAGTIGCRVTDGTYVYALSNNHIYANENDANIGDAALQPGPYDGGQDPGDAIGTLYDFEPIFFDGRDNTIDAAIAISSESDIGCSTPVDGYVIPGSDPVAASIGLDVQKYGRTTGLTQGEVSEIGVTVDVCYQTKGPFLCVKSAKFVDQIAITPGAFAAGGDSGSLIVTDDSNKNPVGLLFAGSSTHTFANRIGPVLDAFGVIIDSGGPVEPVTDIATSEVNAPSPVVQGEEVSVHVTVQNIGNQDAGSFAVVLRDLTDVLDIDTQTVSSLAAGTSTTLNFLWNTSTASIENHTLEGSHDLADDNPSNDAATAVVVIEEALTDIAITEVNAPSPVVQGEEVSVHVTVQNIGNQDAGSFAVVLRDLTDVLDIDTQTVSSLAAGTSTTLNFLWNTSTASIENHTLEGSHDLADDNSSNDAETAVVTVNEAGGITLTATGYKVKGRQKADLEWGGAEEGTPVNIYRDDVFIETTENDGVYTDNIDNVGGGSYIYQVCEEGTTTCSNKATVTF